MTCRIPSRLFVALLVAGASACADSTAPSAGVTDAMLTGDVVGDAAEATAQDLAQMSGAEVLVGMPLTVSAAGASSAFGNCTWDVGTGFHLCAVATTPDGLTLRRYYEIFAHDTTQQNYDAAATDSVLFHAVLAGTLTRADRTAWLIHNRFLMVSGLGGTETQRTWHGAGSRDDSVHVQSGGVVRTTRILSDDALNNIVYKLPHADFPFPQSGTITHEVTVSSTVPDGTEVTNRHGTRHVVATFNGTQFASVMVGTTACTLDLATRKLTCP
jgi:hypothetical protein